MIGDHLTRLVAAPMMTPSGPSRQIWHVPMKSAFRGGAD